jgi:DNA-binding NarL/FixJ family response regulator
MEDTHINIFLVDSHPSDASKIKMLLENNTELPVQVSQCNFRADALRFLKEKSVKTDVIILDLFVVDPNNSEETFQAVHRAAEDIPIVVITEKSSHALACTVTAGGAADIVIRERLELYPIRLLDAIEFSIIRANLLREHKEMSAAEIRQHKRMLHWMTGGYSVEAGLDTPVEKPEIKKKAG